MKQDIGSMWEKRIVREAGFTQDVFIQKVPESMRFNYRTKQIYRKRVCFDFFASVSGRALYFDAKSLAQKSFNLTAWLKAFEQQYFSLLEAHHKGNYAGLLFWFYTYGQIEFVSIVQIKEALDKGLKSVKLGEGKYLLNDDERIDFKAILEALDSPGA